MTDTNIIGIDTQALDKLRSLGWASEATLKRILQKMEGGGNLGAAKSAASNTAASNTTAKEATNIQRRYNKEVSGSIEYMDEFNDEIFKSTGGFKKFSSAMQSTFQALKSSDASKSVKGLFTGTNKLEDIVSGIGTDLNSLGGFFSQMGITGKLAGAGLGALGLGLKGVTYGIGTMRTFTDLLSNINAAGIRIDGGFSALADTAVRTGISMQQLTELITKFGAVSVTLGTRRLMGLQGVFAEGSKRGAEFLMNQGQAQEAFMDSIELMRSSNELQTLTDSQIITRGNNTIKLFNELAIASGRNRDELRKSTVAQTKTVDAFASMRFMGKQSGEAFTKLTASLNAEFGTEGASKLSSIIAKYARGGMAFLDQEERDFATIMGGAGLNLNQITEDLKSGKFEPESINQFGDSLKRLDKEFLNSLNRGYTGTEQFIQSLLQANEQVQINKTRTAEQTNSETQAFNAEMTRQQQRQEALNAIDAATNTAATRFQELVMSGIDPFSTKISSAANSIESLTNAVSKELITKVTELSRFINDNVLPTIDEAFKKRWNEIKKSFMELWSMDWPTITKNFKDIVTAISDAGAKINEWRKWISENPILAGTAAIATAVAAIIATTQVNNAIKGAIGSISGTAARTAATGGASPTGTTTPGTGQAGNAPAGSTARQGWYSKLKNVTGSAIKSGGPAKILGGMALDAATEPAVEFLKQSGHETLSAFTEAISSMGQGALYGSVAGPKGTAIGAIAGLGYHMYSKMDKASPEEMNEINRRIMEGGNEFGMAYEPIIGQPPHPYIGMDEEIRRLHSNANNLSDTTVIEGGATTSAEESEMERILNRILEQLRVNQDRATEQSRRVQLVIEAGNASI